MQCGDERAHHHQQADEKVITDITRTQQRNGYRHSQGDWKCRIDHCRQHAQRRQHQHTADHPQCRQRHQRDADRRRLAGPGAHRRQQKTGDDSHGVAKQHFVAVPQRSLQVGGGQPSGVLRSPQQHAAGTEHAGQQIKRTKAQVPQRKARHDLPNQQGITPPVKRHERTEGAGLDGLDHALQRLVGFSTRRRATVAAGQACHEHHGPVASELA